MPFFESDKAATKYAIQASGKTNKQVASSLWPEKTVERAQTDLNNALNDNRDEQLSSDEHAFIANLCGQYDWLYYHAHKCRHSRPVLQTPEEVAAQVQEQLFQKADELEALLRQIRAVKLRSVA